MNTRRIDIDKTRWIELRDGLFTYVRTRRRWSMDIIVAPCERVSVPRRSAPPAIRTIPFVSYAALFGAPLFVICAPSTRTCAESATRPNRPLKGEPR